jgi:serine phosphatase RsbU (regulator of sigma subunit)/CheY-like chemotaxis protein
MKDSVKILLLNESAIQAKLISDLLLNNEFTTDILVANDRKSFIDLLDNNVVDIMICSHVLPEGFNSLEAFRIAKNIYPNIICILVSGTINDEFAIEILKEGFDNYINNDHLLFLPFSIENAYLKNLYRNEIASLKLKNKKWEKSYKLIEEEKKTITQSIIFASRIQALTLPKIDFLLKNFTEAFIFYKPKDIVSGDFYWFGEKNGNIIVVVADCTGHGVSGALLSMLGSNFLNEILADEDCTSNPSDILTSLDAHICKVLNQSVENGYQDGIDLGLVSINKTEKKLYFCGCERSLLYVLNNKKEIFEYKGNSYLVGGINYRVEKTFLTEEINYETDDVIYMYSDGYVDQFGGENDKKLMKDNFFGILSSFQHLSLEYQGQLLEQRLLKWKGNNEQTDDILVVGIKL